MATKVFFYTLRPYDELSIAQRLAPQLDIEFGYTQEYPTLENAELAKGYFHWSLMDNFEWQKGYAMQFGLIAVNRETMERTAKPSLTVLGESCGA